MTGLRCFMRMRQIAEHILASFRGTSNYLRWNFACGIAAACDGLFAYLPRTAQIGYLVK